MSGSRIRRRSILNHIAGGLGSTREMPSGTWTTRKFGSVKPDGITTIGAAVERYPVGIAWIAIPANISREEFMATCMRAGKVGLFFETGDYVWDVPVDLDVLQKIDFPYDYGELGSCVVYVNMPKHNTPIVVGVLSKDSEAQDYVEDVLKLRKFTNSAHSEIMLDGRNGGMTQLHTSTDPNKPPKLFSMIGDKDVEAWVERRVWGQIFDYIIGDKNTYVSNSVEWIVRQADYEDQESTQTVFGYYSGVGWNYSDEFENIWKMEDQKMTIDSPEILHGANAEEPAVLGDTLEDILGDLLDAINALTVPTGVGPSGVPLNVAQFEAVRARLIEFKSQKNKIE